ncbi:unnamed protein product [Oikopleura dioica]|uniref:Uncharacterized protein n=1 Tax=Oikopleura dioica TaxID=34765 RepID=E4XFF0_OIKDI|nr:unnamed protein product [Oikopleura dioica]
MSAERELREDICEYRRFYAESQFYSIKRKNNEEELVEINNKVKELKDTLQQLEHRRQEVELQENDNNDLVLMSDNKKKIKGEKINEKFGVKAHDFLDPLGPFPTLAKNEIKTERKQYITENSDRFLIKIQF